MNEAATIIDKHRNNDFDIVAKLEKAGYRYENEMLVNTTIESTYKMDIYNQDDELKATAIISSEEGSGTMLKRLNWY